MNNASNKCITDSSLRKKLNKIKEFKQKIVGIKQEDLKKDSGPKSDKVQKSKDKIDSLFFTNDHEKSGKRHKLKLITRNQLFIYFDEIKNKKGQSLYPIIEEAKNGKNSNKSKSFRLSNIKSHKTIQIKDNKIKIIKKMKLRKIMKKNLKRKKKKKIKKMKRIKKNMKKMTLKIMPK